MMAQNGVLSVQTKQTGRSPQNRFIVRDSLTQHTVDWGTINQPIELALFQERWQTCLAYLDSVDHFRGGYHIGAHPQHHMMLKSYTTTAWHQLFARQLFIHKAIDEDKAWKMIHISYAHSQQLSQKPYLIICFSEKKILLCGLDYAGEMKKACFSILNFMLTDQDVLPMHCAASTDSHQHAALFFGLSGTGKTTLSADPHRSLIGDDEHGWAKDGIFNFEGGCYAKCIHLSYEQEPLIWEAIHSKKPGIVMENVVLDQALNPLFEDDSITENTRVVYPRTVVPHALKENRVLYTPQTIFLLSCDLYGILPAVSKLTTAQAMYYFLSGYTTLLGGTEDNIEMKPIFSACFGAPFLPRSPVVYANLFYRLLSQNPNIKVYLINTGWHQGPYGIGKRFAIPITRRIVDAVIKREIMHWAPCPIFQLAIPKSIPGLHSALLDPRSDYDPKSYQKNAYRLVQAFQQNFKRFQTDSIFSNAGPI